MLTQNNLYNPMVVDEINIHQSTRTVITLPMALFELIPFKDSTKIYKVIHECKILIYHGDKLITKYTKNEIKYFLTTVPKHKEYVLYLRETIDDNIYDLEINRYTDPQLAINALCKYNNV